MKTKTLLLALLIPSIAFCFAIAADLSGKWTCNVSSPNGEITINYTFNVSAEKLSGTLEGPQGSTEIQNGVVKGSDFSFDILNAGNNVIHQTGKYYGDSVAINFTARNRPIHLKLIRAKQ